MKIIHKNKENMINWVRQIFEDVYADNVNSINKYLCWQIVVIFNDKTFFVYEPFECFEVMDNYYNRFNRNAIADIIIDNPKEAVTTTIPMDSKYRNKMKNWKGNMQMFMWEYFSPDGYNDVMFEED